ncbi:MAG TPA: coenzyme F420-0:L-glutamate ligase [Thermomicrobiales bacterium]|jgi:coenzyme F420-0:L-glutamate ligase/coenzyme F420-1:gamma-L-glutamate ligase
MPPRVTITGLDGIPEVRVGDDVAALILNAVAVSGERLQDGDLLVVTHKIISKAEGQLIDLRDVQPSELAQRHAERWGKDARQIEIVLRESARIVRMQQGLIIAETHHGFVCANAAVDASNVASEFVCLLPRDPDASAARLRAELLSRTGIDLPVIISDSFGRAWRFGITNVAIGLSGLSPLVDYRGQQDPQGRTLHASVLAIADELAASAELVANKLDGRPVALIRGYDFTRAEGSGRELLLDPTRDLFR